MRAPASLSDSLPPGRPASDYLLCLVQSCEQVREILDDLSYAGLTRGSVVVFRPEQTEPCLDDDGVLHTTGAVFSQLARALCLSDRDAEGCLAGIQGGGTVIAVHARSAVGQDNVRSIYRERGAVAEGFWGRRVSWLPRWDEAGAA